jgi:hypothetical protein
MENATDELALSKRRCNQPYYLESEKNVTSVKLNTSWAYLGRAWRQVPNILNLRNVSMNRSPRHLKWIGKPNGGQSTGPIRVMPRT